MRLFACAIAFFLLLFGFARAISIPHWVSEDANAGPDPNALLRPGVFIKTLGEAVSEQASQILLHLETLKSEIQKIDLVVQDSNVTSHILDAFTLQASKLQTQFTSPIPDETAARHTLLTQSIDKTMDILATVVADVGKVSKTDTRPIRQAFEEARQPVKDAALFMAKITDDHPCLFELVRFVLVVEVPGFWLLRPVLQGMGFSSKGPTKGSLAAGIQSKAYGGRVPKGSIFSKLQKAGMM